jgi:exo-beta-1,3-glucanase (GH17 family)
MKPHKFFLIFCLLLALFSQNVLIAQSEIVRLKWINFSPYTQSGQNPNRLSIIPESQIIALLDSIEPWVEGIRTFGTTNGLEKIPQLAKERGLKVIVGIWLNNNNTTNAEQIASGISIANAGYADKLIVGSEVLLRNELPASKIIEYINEVKLACPTIPVSYADIASNLIGNPGIVNACDFVSPNIYPFWEGISINCAMQRFHQEYQSLIATAGSKEIIISESGWKTNGPWVGEAEPSLSNAIRFNYELLSWSKVFGITVNLFSAFDEPWKLPNDDGWGIFYSNATLKPGMEKLFSSIEEIDSTWFCYKLFNEDVDTLTIDFIPEVGSYLNIKGRANFIKPCENKIGTYIKVAGNWWIKPYSASPTVPIQCNGHWDIDYTTGGIDQMATDFFVYLIPDDYTPPNCSPCGSIPSDIYTNALSTKHIVRCPLPYGSVSVDPSIICQGDTSILGAEGGISYLWNTEDTTETIYVSPSTTTNYYVMVTIPAGCVETRYANVTVLPSEVNSISTSICDGDSIIVGDSIFSETGNYSVTLSNRNGCDSIIMLDLIVNPTNLIDLTDTIQQGEYVQIGDSVFSETGNYSVILSNQYGCDSIVNLALTVKVINQNLMLTNLTITNEKSECFNAYDTIIVAGNSTFVIFESGSIVDLIAGKSILFLPGFHAYEGCYAHANITTDSTFCDKSSASYSIDQRKDKSMENNLTSTAKITIQGEKSVKIYPNPNNGQLTIDLNNFDNGADICIYNMLGKNIHQSLSGNNPHYEINLPEIPSGVYLVLIRSGKEQYTKKIMVKE